MENLWRIARTVINSLPTRLFSTMDTLIHADIFFFVTTIAVVLVSVAIIIVLGFVIKILNNVRKISDTIRNESGLLVEDVHELRTKMHRDKITAGGIFNFFRDLFARKSGRKDIQK